MDDMPSAMWSEEKLDHVLALANRLEIGFKPAFNLYKAGYTTSDQVAVLSAEDLAAVSGLTMDAAEAVVNRLWSGQQWSGSEETISGAGPAIIEAEVLADTVPPYKADPNRNLVKASSFEPPDPNEPPLPLLQGAKIEFGKFYQLNPNIKMVWSLSGPLWAGVLFALCLSPLIFFIPLVAAVMFLMILVTVAGTVIWARLLYDNYHFAFTTDLIIVRSGILYKQEIQIPYGRIQNINSHQGVLDRIFGVWHLSVSATGTTSMIHGVPEHEKVKAFILENVEAIKARRVPKVDSGQGYREVYVALKKISQILKGPGSRAVAGHQ